MNDRQLRQLVIDELTYDPSIESVHIGVTVDNGIVTLSGHVPSYPQKLAAERAVWRVRGVRAIAEELQVRLPGDKKTHNDEIAARALSILNWNTQVPRDAVRVQVSNGWITLSGEVDWNYQRQAAEREVRMLSGVTGVSNTISLKSRADLLEVRERITTALKRRAEVESARIRIEIVGDGTVRLEGEVDDWDQRHAVEQAVWAAPGVRRIDDRLRIQ